MAVILVSPLVNVFYRRRRQETAPVEDAAPAISVVVPAIDYPDSLPRLLDSILQQEYEPGFEIIVVADKKDADMADVLERYEQNERIYITFVPVSSRYMSPRKLAVTLGVKAAHNEWILMTEADCIPTTRHWLRTMARRCCPGIDMVLGFSNWDGATSQTRRFIRMRNASYMLDAAMSGTAYTAGTNNLLFRKDMFLEGKGYDGNLKFVCGEFDFLVNKFARRGNTAVETDPEGWVYEKQPSEHVWRQYNMFQTVARRNLQYNRKGILPYVADMVAMWAGISLPFLLQTMMIAMGWKLDSAMSIIMWLLPTVALAGTLAVRGWLASMAAEKLGVSLTPMEALAADLKSILQDIRNAWNYIQADKYDFISHKV